MTTTRSRTTRRVLAGLVAAATLFSLAACSKPAGNAGGSTSNPVTLQYWLWDDAQLPGYQKCADNFTKDNPTIKVQITQYAWGQYWQNLATQIAANTAPDVWVDQGSYYPQFVADKQIDNLQPYIDKDKVDLKQYAGSLTDIWVKDGARYGLPKDWDTIGLVINKKMATDAGLSEADLAKLTWNPKDGGTFEQVIAKLTVDANGKRGNEAGFDKNNVKVFGFLPEWGDGSQGQNLWGNLAVSNGFYYADVNPFGKKFNYDDPKLAETITWMAGLADKGYAPQLDVNSTLDRRSVQQAGGAAMTTVGSFNQMLFKDDPKSWIFAPLPAGPQGVKSAINGLSDAMYAGGKHKDQAWQWIKYLGSAACQNVIGNEGIVFPAIQSGYEASVKTRSGLGLDASVFTSYLSDPKATFLIPISDHGGEISQLIQDAIQSVGLHKSDAATALKTANDKVNALFK